MTAGVAQRGAVPRVLGGVLLVAAAATALDAIWYGFGVRHTVTAGVIHGAVLLTVVGGVLGALAGRPLRGLPIGALAGVGGALAYYAIVALIDGHPYGVAIPASWIVLWLVLAVCDGRWLRSHAPRSWPEVAVRGVLAAAAGGVAFYLVLRLLWGSPPAGAGDWAVQLGAWAFAWSPGILVLALPRPR